MQQGWRRAFRLPFGRQQLARELDDELAFHLAMREARLRAAGLPDGDARLQAERRFGDYRRIRAECLTIDRGRMARERSLMVLDDFRHDVTVALRALARVPAFTATAALTLALGIGATAAIFSVAYGVLLRPLPFPEGDRLVQLFTVSGGNADDRRGYWSKQEYQDLAASVPSLALTGAFNEGEVTMTGTGTPERLRMVQATPGVFQALRVRPVVGRLFTDAEVVEGASPVAVLSHGLWQRRFGGDARVVGRTVQLGGTPVVVVGVLPRGIELSGAELYLSFDLARLDRPRGSHFLRVVGRLAPGATVERAETELQALGARSARDFPESYRNPRFTMTAVPLREAWVGEVRAVLVVLLGAVALLLLLACVNVANLLLVRGEARQREIGVRVALGAGRGRLARQLLTETLLLALLGAAIGLPLATLGARGLIALNPEIVPSGTHVGVDGVVLAAAAAIVLVTAVLAGLVPALQAGRLDVRGAIGLGAVGGGRHGGRLRALLVTAEIAVATLVLVGATLVGRSFWQLMRVDPGFSREQVLTFDTSIPATRVQEGARVPQAYAELLARLEALPQVRRVATTSHLPMSGSTGDWMVEVEGYELPAGQALLSPDFRVVSEGLFDVLGIPLLQGRTFGAGDRAEGPFAIVVSEAFARHFFGDGPAIGRRVRFGAPPDRPQNPWMTVAGVVGDVRAVALNAPPRPTYYILDRQFPTMVGQPIRSTSVVLRAAGDGRPLLAAIPRTVWAQDPELAVARLRTLREIVGQSVSRERFATAVLLAFGAVALLLAITGVYGVLSYSVARRRREMGIRMALGARTAQVRRSVVRDGARLAAVGLVAGLVGAFAGSRLLTSLLYEVPATDPLSFAAAALLLTLAALAATYFPARRATRVNPVEALRTD